MQPEGKDHPERSPQEEEEIFDSKETPVFASIDALVGTRLDQYKIVKEIGRGAMGVVFEAFNINEKQKVALKVLPPNINLSDRIIRRFLREAESVAKLSHPNIVKIFGVGQKESIYFYAMELVEGVPLDELLKKEEKLPFKRVAYLILQACEAIHFAHKYHIIHRDIKPGNIIITHGDKVVLTDFGLARQEKAATLTESGALVGTPIYMSPEQVMAKRGGVDKRTDVYSLGVTLYQLLLGKPPFTGDSTQEILNQILEEEPKPPHRQRLNVPRSLSVISIKAMEKEPGRRFQSAEDMAEELRRYLRGVSIKSKPASLLSRIGKRIKKHKIISGLIGLMLLLTIGYSTNIIQFSKEIQKTHESLSTVMEEHEKEQKYNENVEHAQALLAHPGIGTNLPSAISLLKEAMLIFPNRAEAHFYLGKAFSLKETPRSAADALEAFTAAVNNAPDSCEYLLERALFLLKQGRQLNLDNAIYLGFSDLQKAMEIDMGNPTIAYHMAKTLYDCSDAADLDFEEQRTIITWAYQYAISAQAFGTTADVECLLAQIFLEIAKYATSEMERRNNLEKAHACLSKALELDKNHHLAFRLAGEVKKKIEEPELTAQEVDTRELMEEQGLGNFFTNAGRIYEELKKDIEDRLSETKKSELIDGLINVFLSPDPMVSLAPPESGPQDPSESDLDEELNYPTLLEKASDYIETKEYQSAIDCYKKAIILNPAEAHELNFEIADAYFTLGKQVELNLALQHARLAYSQKPQDGRYLNLLARILEKLEDRDGLKRLYDEAQKNGTLSFFGIKLHFLSDEENKSLPH